MPFATTELEMAEDAREYLLANGGTEAELANNQRVIDKYRAETRSPIPGGGPEPTRRSGGGDGTSVTSGETTRSLRKPASELDAGEGFGDTPAAPRKGSASPAAIEFAQKLIRQFGAMTSPTSANPDLAAQTIESVIASIPELSKAKVSKLIDDMKAKIADLETKGIRAPQPGRLATDPQRALIRRLLIERINPVGEMATRWETIIGDRTLTFDEGGDLICELRSTPDRRAEIETAGEGMYRNPENGEIYKVQIAHHGSGKLYGKLMTKLDEPVTKRGKEVHYEFQYVQGLLARIQPEWKLTLEEAQEWGHLYGCCVRCGTILTDEGSIDRGIGPVCAGKL